MNRVAFQKWVDSKQDTVFDKQLGIHTNNPYWNICGPNIPMRVFLDNLPGFTYVI